MRRARLTALFWGTRGSIPIPGPTTLRTGGNTACIELRWGRHRLILDGGSGIRLLGRSWRGRGRISILVSHTHMDHILGIPFFRPALQRGQKIQIFGPPGLRRALHRLFPFPCLKSRPRIKEIRQGTFRIPPFRIETRRLHHPGGALGFRITIPGGPTIAYLSDHEARGAENLSHWLGRPDLLILDSQYLDKEYPAHRGWGHSSLSDTISVALASGARRLALFHHNPLHSDAVLEAKLRRARRIAKKRGARISIFLAREGLRLHI